MNTFQWTLLVFFIFGVSQLLMVMRVSDFWAMTWRSRLGVAVVAFVAGFFSIPYYAFMVARTLYRIAFIDHV